MGSEDLEFCCDKCEVELDEGKGEEDPSVNLVCGLWIVCQMLRSSISAAIAVRNEHPLSFSTVPKYFVHCLFSGSPPRGRSRCRWR